MKLFYTDRAIADIEIAFSWYEKQRTGLGHEFLDCVELSVKSICAMPEMYQLIYANFRGCIIRKFPFTIFYTIEEEGLIVHSVFNNRQDPSKRPKK